MNMRVCMSMHIYIYARLTSIHVLPFTCGVARMGGRFFFWVSTVVQVSTLLAHPKPPPPPPHHQPPTTTALRPPNQPTLHPTLVCPSIYRSSRGESKWLVDDVTDAYQDLSNVVIKGPLSFPVTDTLQWMHSFEWITLYIRSVICKLHWISSLRPHIYYLHSYVT